MSLHYLVNYVRKINCNNMKQVLWLPINHEVVWRCILDVEECLTVRLLQTTAAFKLKNSKLECGPMPNMIAAQPNIGGALCESSVIFQSLYHAAKFGWRLLLECRAVTLPIQENARLGRKVNFVAGKIPSAGKSPRKCISIHQSINQSINQSFNASWQTATRHSEWVHNCTVLKITIT